MSSAEATLECSQPVTGREAAWADIAERRRQDPDWNPHTDPTYAGPLPAFLELMTSDAELDSFMAARSGAASFNVIRTRNRRSRGLSRGRCR